MNCPALFRLAPNRVWRTYLGGRTLDTISGNPNPEDTHFPEDWILSTTRAVNTGREDIDEGRSFVETESGVEPLSDWLERFPNEILGAAHVAKYGKNTGFLLKYLDSSIRLHIQCHPTIPFAQKYLNSNSGKSEGYVILGNRPEVEPYIYLGFQNPIPPEEFKMAIEKQDTEKILSCFEKIPVKAGDVFFVPGGLPHAIGEGVFMIEIMEPTDFAVRIEFERGGYVLPEASRFMNRGVDFAISMFNFDKKSVQDIKNEQFVTPEELPVEGDAKRWSLFDSRYTKCFRAERFSVNGKAALERDEFRVIIITEGSGTLEIDGKSYPVKQYDRFLIPAKTSRVELNGKLEAVAVLPPAH